MSLASIEIQALTPREEEILALVADGLSNQAIAEKSILSQKTVKNRVSDIFSKLGVSNRLQAATWFHKRSRVKAPEKPKTE